MPVKTTHSGYVDLKTPPRELAEHGLHYAQNRIFFIALLDVVQLLRIECLIRECHPLHDKLVELEELVRTEVCQDYVATTYPDDL